MAAADPSVAVSATGDLSSNNPPYFAWLSDSRRIVAAVERNSVQGMHLWIFDTQSGDATPLTAGAGIEDAPSVSPDGRRIAYASQEANFDLLEIPTDGSSPRSLLATTRNEMEPAWSPTNSQYAFVTDRSGHPEIWLRSQDGGWERRLVGSEDFPEQRTHTFRAPAFSPDGQRIAFERVTASGAFLWISTLAGGSPIQISKPHGAEFFGEYSPTWSPDGEWVAFASALPGRWSLAKRRVGDDTPPVLLSEVTSFTHPQWSPDNRWIACNTTQGLTLISPDGKTTKLLREEVWPAFAWSGDGSTLFGIRQGDDLRELVFVAIDVTSGRDRVLNGHLAQLPPVNAPVKGFTRISDKSFATSLVHVRSDLWLIDDFLPTDGIFDRFWRRAD